MKVDPPTPPTSLTEIISPYYQIKYNKTWDQGFQIQVTKTRYIGHGESRTAVDYKSWDDASAPVTVAFQSPIKIDIASGDANNLTVKISSNKEDFTVSGNIKTSGACYKSMEQEILSLQQSLPSSISTMLNGVSFSGISVLALKSILFPGKYMKLQIGYCPGDMALFGQLDNLQI